MRKIILAVCLCLPVAVWGASEIEWDMAPMDPDLENLPSLQNGMRLYMNYCLGCHELGYQRYERTADDLGIPHDIALQNLVFTGQKIGELMTNAMDAQMSKQWFGVAPPDLTMITRYKSPEYVYNYLQTFYVDESRPFGVNNKVFANVAMPNVLVDLQGVQREACVQEAEFAGLHGELDGELDGEIDGEMRTPQQAGTAATCNELAIDEGSGEYDAEQFAAAAYDLTNFLYYVGEPSRLERYRIGIYVLLFLVILGCLTYLLNREYWKDVH